MQPSFRDAVAAIDAGELAALERQLAADPELLRDRADYGEAYFHRPYLLWFVAGNPSRTERLAPNIVEIANAIIAAAKNVETLQQQLDYTLELVASSALARESGAQHELIDLLVDSGASPDCTLSAVMYRELAAAEQLLARGARLTLPTAIATRRVTAELIDGADADERAIAFAAAAFFGDVATLATLLARGASISAYSPPAFHPHATALHHAVDGDSLAAVRFLVEAGADLTVEDRIYRGTPLGWAEYLGRTEIAAYLRSLPI
ncbi:MAG: Peptide methionine sulfoxide reductase msrA [Acidobacteria bacterium]|nr:Peptide methionine sulfoxide reductase msrA [Acidobacteriota bacterium]